MTNQSPITPPPSKLVLRWIGELFNCSADGELSDTERFIATRAAQWGADQELEACLCEVSVLNSQALADRVRAARRPKPPNLKEQAQDSLQIIMKGYYGDPAHADLIRRALKQLPDEQ